MNTLNDPLDEYYETFDKVEGIDVNNEEIY